MHLSGIRPFVRLFVVGLFQHGPTAANPPLQVCCCKAVEQEMSIECCTAVAQQLMRRNADSATFSAYVGS